MSTPSLSIGELSRLTGLNPATIRVWEARYGFPVPERGAGGQRSYGEEVVAQLRQVLADRQAGLALPAAIERSRSTGTSPGPSLHAFLRRRSPSLPTQRLTKHGLAALTRAVEDEGHSRAGRPGVLAAGFQAAEHFAVARARWEDLAAGAEVALVFADFDHDEAGEAWPRRVRVASDHPLNQEWFVVWYGARYTACLSGRELPGQGGRRNRDRVLETVWTVDSQLVVEAARAVLAVADELAPGLGLGRSELDERHPDPAEELDIVYALTNRMVSYLAPTT